MRSLITVLVSKDGSLLEKSDEISLNGFSHVAGMVASGKSTLAHLVAAYILKNCPDHRLTLVVSDVQSAIKSANQINWWFLPGPEAPEKENPVAVPIFGRSQREQRLREFTSSQDYQDHCQRSQAHWGERWLSPICPLQALIDQEDVESRLQHRFIKPGKEPCQALKEVSAASNGQILKRGTSPLEKDKWKERDCPFLPSCPQYQVYRDMPKAQVWITTPGGLASGSLPRPYERCSFKVGELVYEHSNLVIFDEVDTIIKWFDDAYATEITLTNGKDGIFDSITVATEQYSIQHRVMPTGTQRWVGAERSAQQVVSAVLTLLDPYRGKVFLQDWVSRHAFTPNTLFYKLARRIAGFEEAEPIETPDEVRQQHDAETKKVMYYFENLLHISDPLHMPPPATGAQENPVYRLSQILQKINSIGESASDTVINLECTAWVQDFFPDTTDKLLALATSLAEKSTNNSGKKRRSKSEENVETINTLSYRLQFALTVALLDRHSRIIFYEWDNRPSAIHDSSPRFRNTSSMLEILPLPLTGRQFGTYLSKGNHDDLTQTGGNNSLSIFAYTNIGRYYVLNYHRLLMDFTGKRGPNVLALSGTSYLPDSTSFHVSLPQGLLMPQINANEAIGRSKFHFLPQYLTSGLPIRISGQREKQKPGLFRKMAAALVGIKGDGVLNQTLKEISKLSINSPEDWLDRERILIFVNSYDQAKWAADAIRQNWPSMQLYVKHLVPDAGYDLEENHEVATSKVKSAIHRSDIEEIVKSGAKVLVAPLSAIGRGFNILNERGKAAFGAVFFLTRPYPQPHDTKLIAQEMNRRALDWVEDDSFSAWEKDGISSKADAIRREAGRYWRSVESRSYYFNLQDIPELRSYPRKDLAATTVGYIVQAVGRLLRGGVPFHAYFVDAAWGPEYAKDSEKVDTPRTSLLAAMIQLLSDYVAEDLICDALYKPLAESLDKINNFQWQPDQKIDEYEKR